MSNAACLSILAWISTSDTSKSDRYSLSRYSSYETSLYQPVYSIVAKNSNSKEQDRFVSVINDTLEKLVKDGINERTIEAGINYYEFKYREADYGPYPKGLMYSC